MHDHCLTSLNLTEEERDKILSPILKTSNIYIVICWNLAQNFMTGTIYMPIIVLTKFKTEKRGDNIIIILNHEHQHTVTGNLFY